MTKFLNNSDELQLVGLTILSSFSIVRLIVVFVRLLSTVIRNRVFLLSVTRVPLLPHGSSVLQDCILTLTQALVLVVLHLYSALLVILLLFLL